jgi:hypothetical protein
VPAPGRRDMARSSCNTMARSSCVLCPRRPGYSSLNPRKAHPSRGFVCLPGRTSSCTCSSNESWSAPKPKDSVTSIDLEVREDTHANIGRRR